MAVIYTDTTTKYNLTTIGLQGAANAKSFMESLMMFLAPIETTLNQGLGLIMNGVVSIFNQKTERQKNEQNYLLAADNAGYNQENNMLNIIIIVIFLVAFIYLERKKK